MYYAILVLLNTTFVRSLISVSENMVMITEPQPANINYDTMLGQSWADSAGGRKHLTLKALN